ncbi:AAA family ATPase [Glycomyces sp. NRRL B-16210]|uniref:AAA family ATPase n=1 Tax=Glycomyces sp. NRRL B-16210 TaxID=1463821 RepID=UPI0004BEC131|nr:AAA family ATPase [Glycomyces sp. NRRL B-16210]
MEDPNPFNSRIFITHVKVENFASIRECEVELGWLTILTGPNAAGKSNFLKAIAFALSADPLRDRVQKLGGIDALLYRSGNQVADSFQIELMFRRFHRNVPDGTAARYTLTVGRDRAGRPKLYEEIMDARGDWGDATFGFAAEPRAARNFLVFGEPLGPGPHLHGYLENIDTPDLKDMVSCAHFYDLDSEVLRETDLSLPQERCDALGEKGEHLGHVLGRLAEGYPEVKAEIDDYLSIMIPNALGIDQKRQGDYSEIEGRFRVEGSGSDEPVVEVFRSTSLSEGTLRLAGILAALNQWCVQQGHIKFLAIEEPEKALHPPKLGVLFEVLDSSSHMAQVLVTTQSPDLLDNKAAKPEHILAVENVDGETVITPLNEVTLALHRDKVASLTELMRMGVMGPVRPDENSGHGGEA